MDGLTDLHCHILPYVDDGAENLAESETMLELQAEQGVAVIAATPHMRYGMFETTAGKVGSQFERLRDLAEEFGLQLLPGREYFCDEHFLELLQKKELQPLGYGNSLLMEFSGRYDVKTIAEYLQRAAEQGYHPVVAHAERYPCFQREPEKIKELIALGAWIQVNAGSVLGREGLRQKHLCSSWMKADCIHLVASDAHHADYREPNLGEAAEVIKKKHGSAYAQRLFLENPARILKIHQN